MADAQACSLNKNTTQYGGHFVFVFFGFRFFWPVMFACLLARLFRFCFVYIVSSSPFRFLASLARFFSRFFFSYRFQCGARRRRDVITHRRRLSRNFTHRPFSTRYFRFIYISKALVKIRIRKCRQKAAEKTAAPLSSSSSSSSSAV